MLTIKLSAVVIYIYGLCRRIKNRKKIYNLSGHKSLISLMLFDMHTNTLHPHLIFIFDHLASMLPANQKRRAGGGKTLGSASVWKAISHFAICLTAFICIPSAL